MGSQRRGLSRIISSYESDRLKGVVDSYVGICIIALYFTYFLVVKGMLSVFSCVRKNGGPPILTEDPSVQVIEPDIARCMLVRTLLHGLRVWFC